MTVPTSTEAHQYAKDRQEQGARLPAALLALQKDSCTKATRSLPVHAVIEPRATPFSLNMWLLKLTQLEGKLLQALQPQ